MPMKRALQIVLAISIVGVLFSGTLVYREVCSAGTGGCMAGGGPGTILGLPVCVYGLVMYLLLTAVASFGLAGAEPSR